jgi:hypothetical protein
MSKEFSDQERFQDNLEADFTPRHHMDHSHIEIQRNQ